MQDCEIETDTDTSVHEDDEVNQDARLSPICTEVHECGETSESSTCKLDATSSAAHLVERSNRKGWSEMNTEGVENEV